MVSDFPGATAFKVVTLNVLLRDFLDLIFSLTDVSIYSIVSSTPEILFISFIHSVIQIESPRNWKTEPQLNISHQVISQRDPIITPKLSSLLSRHAVLKLMVSLKWWQVTNSLNVKMSSWCLARAFPSTTSFHGTKRCSSFYWKGNINSHLTRYLSLCNGDYLQDLLVI